MRFAPTATPPAATRPDRPATLFVPGLVLGCVTALGLTPHEQGPPPRVAAVQTRFALADDHADWSARELRLLPGIGERRALAVVAARRAHRDRAGRPLRWEEVPGVGARTAARVRAFLRARGAAHLEVGRP